MLFSGALRHLRLKYDWRQTNSKVNLSLVFNWLLLDALLLKLYKKLKPFLFPD